MDTPCPFLIFAQLTPRIFDFPIFSCFFRTHSTITHCQYPVVQRCAAGTGKDPGFVKLKPGLVGFNGNGHRLFVKRRHQRLLGLPDIGVFFHGGTGDLFAFLVAGAAGAGVRVGGFRAQAFVGVNEIKRIVHQTTVAALVHFGVAIDQILFGKRRQRASFQEVSAFQRPGGGKSPATAALALVFNGRDRPFLGPIDGSGFVGGVILGDLVNVPKNVGRGQIWTKARADVHFFKLTPREMAKLIHPHGVVGRRVAVVFGNRLEIFLEDLEPKVIVVYGDVGVLLLPSRVHRTGVVGGQRGVQGVGRGDPDFGVQRVTIQLPVGVRKVGFDVHTDVRWCSSWDTVRDFSHKRIPFFQWAGDPQLGADVKADGGNFGPEYFDGEFDLGFVSDSNIFLVCAAESDREILPMDWWVR